MSNITVITTTIIINRDNKILLVKRNNETFYNTWGLPGGKVKYKEKIINANGREHKEELNVKLINAKLIKYFEFFNPDHAIVFCFMAKIKNKIVPDPKEIKQYKWFSFDEIKKKKLAPNHLAVIKYYFNTIKI